MYWLHLWIHIVSWLKPAMISNIGSHQTLISKSFLASWARNENVEMSAWHLGQLNFNGIDQFFTDRVRLLYQCLFSYSQSELSIRYIYQSQEVSHLPICYWLMSIPLVPELWINTGNMWWLKQERQNIYIIMIWSKKYPTS